jgi:hypothetical protein
MMKSFVGGYKMQVNMDQVRKIEKLDGGIKVTYQNGDDEMFHADNEIENEIIEELDRVRI